MLSKCADGLNDKVVQNYSELFAQLFLKRKLKLCKIFGFVGSFAFPYYIFVLLINDDEYMYEIKKEIVLSLFY